MLMHPHTCIYVCILRRTHAQFDGTHAAVVCGKAKAVTSLFQAPASFSSAHIGRVPGPEGNILCNATMLFFQDLARILSLFFFLLVTLQHAMYITSTTEGFGSLRSGASIFCMYASAFLQVQRVYYRQSFENVAFQVKKKIN